MTLNSLPCADVPLSNYSVTQCLVGKLLCTRICSTLDCRIVCTLTAIESWFYQAPKGIQAQILHLGYRVYKIS